MTNPRRRRRLSTQKKATSLAPGFGHAVLGVRQSAIESQEVIQEISADRETIERGKAHARSHGSATG